MRQSADCKCTQAVRMGRGGLRWSDVVGPERDPLCAMGTVLLIMGVEWFVFLIISLYMDQAREVWRDIEGAQILSDTSTPTEGRTLTYNALTRLRI